MRLARSEGNWPTRLTRFPSKKRNGPHKMIFLIIGGAQGDKRAHEGALPRLARLTVCGITSALTRAAAQGRVPGALALLIEGPDELPEAWPQPATFGILPNTGLLCRTWHTPHGPVRVCN